MFARMIAAAGGDEARQRFSRKERGEIRRWLEPVDTQAVPASACERPSHLARRIEALRHALDKPEPIVRRLAGFLARLPKGLLQPSSGSAAERSFWRDGEPEFHDGCRHLKQAARAFERLEPG